MLNAKIKIKEVIVMDNRQNSTNINWGVGIKRQPKWGPYK